SRSEDGGTTWHELSSPVTDQRTAWSHVATNIQPNQGDYLGLFANGDAVYPVWADGRDGNPNVYTDRLPLQLTPVEAALASVCAEPGRVTLTWTDGGDGAATGTVEKSGDGIAWERLGTVLPDGLGQLTW